MDNFDQEALFTIGVPRGEDKDEIQMAGKFSQIQTYIFFPVFCFLIFPYLSREPGSDLVS